MPNIENLEQYNQWTQNLPCGQAEGQIDAHDKANSQVSQSPANQPKNVIIP
jgi:hypothetical protein